jgi:predicted transcriptional regulator
MATVAHVRGLIASGSEEVIPAEVVARLDAGDSPIRVFREFRRMTQGQLAAAVDLDQSFISKIEAGTKHPTAANLGRLARALKVDADLLLPDED